MKDKLDIKAFLLLHIAILIYSLGLIFSKMASSVKGVSPSFLVCYGLFIVCLGIYALVWQQVLKKVNLVTAFCNKAMTIIWGMLFGVLFFQEKIGWINIVGAMMVIIGVIIVVAADE